MHASLAPLNHSYPYNDTTVSAAIGQPDTDGHTHSCVSSYTSTG